MIPNSLPLPDATSPLRSQAGTPEREGVGDRFDVIVMSQERKFLSRKSCPDALETARFVQQILQRDVVGSLSIRRVVPKVAEP